MSNLFEDLLKASGATQRVFEILDRSPSLVSGEQTLEDLEGSLSIQEPAFSYPSRPDVRCCGPGPQGRSR